MIVLGLAMSAIDLTSWVAEAGLLYSFFVAGIDRRQTLRCARRRNATKEWIATYGTPDQQARQAAGVLPMEQAIEAMTDHAFAVLADRPRYQRGRRYTTGNTPGLDPIA